jgi:hypothetical protein
MIEKFYYVVNEVSNISNPTGYFTLPDEFEGCWNLTAHLTKDFYGRTVINWSNGTKWVQVHSCAECRRSSETEITPVARCVGRRSASNG